MFDLSRKKKFYFKKADSEQYLFEKLNEVEKGLTFAYKGAVLTPCWLEEAAGRQKHIKRTVKEH